MNLLTSVVAWLSLSSPTQGPLPINVDSKTGDTISGEKDFRVTVDSGEIINQVEFYVGDDLRDTETSTPYMFPFDTVNESDGDVKVKFKAYTSQNKVLERTLTLHIDNEKSKGPDFHVKLGQDDLSDSKYKAALDQGRIAMKLDPKNNGARFVLARANMGLKVFDKAQKYAEDAVAQDPKDDAAFQLLAAIDVQRAFSTFAKSDSDKADVLASIGQAFTAAVTARKSSLDLEVDKVGDPTDTNIIEYADTANRAERYSLTISGLSSRFKSNPKNQQFLDRLAYADIRSGRYQDALDAMSLAKSQGATFDAYAYALEAITLLQIGRTEDSAAAIKLGIESDPDNLGVRTAQAFIALQQNKNSVLSGLTTDLARDQGQKPTVLYYLMALSNRAQRYGEARRYFEKAVLAEPALPDLYIEEANYALGLAIRTTEADQKKTALDTAKMYYQTALVSRPESTNALSGLAVIDLLQKNVKEAVSYAEAARNASPDVASGHYVAAAAYEAANLPDNAKTENNKAGALDPINLKGRSMPDAVQIYQYLVSTGRIPAIVPPSN